uniref:Uncharacterized protein n=1 Tax=Hucho hucho TaxID=62062 RepID=A0A4W5N451_9TELE
MNSHWFIIIRSHCDVMMGAKRSILLNRLKFQPFSSNGSYTISYCDFDLILWKCHQISSCLSQVVEILQKMYACGAHELGLNFINKLIVRFCHSPKWVGRQAFAFICQAIVEEDCMPMDQFAQHLLPSLLSLSLDPVANVCVLVAKALRQSVMEKGKDWALLSTQEYV